MITPDHKLLKESFKDVTDDFDELLYLVTSQRKRLDTFVADIKKVQSELRPEIVKKVFEKSLRLVDINEQYRKRIDKGIQLSEESNKVGQLNRLYNEKLLLFELIRIHYSETAALITSTDWQSPSYLHTHFSMAGKQTGRIVGTENDYKRDQHLDGLVFENKFKQEYIDSFFKLPIQVFATNSGMAAFTTILNFLQMRKKITGPILVGKSIYFENKTMLKNIFRDVVEVDENNLEEIRQEIEKIKPSIVVFDSLSNTAHIPMPNLTEIIKYLTKIKRNTYLLVDNTGLSISYQVLKQTIGKSPFLHTIVFESLNKYYQFGMDRVTGGVFWIHGREQYDLFKTREFSGTNIADASSYSIPTPNRRLLSKRLERFERNTKLLASFLQKHIDENPGTMLSNIIYSGLPNHVSFEWARNKPFHGSFFNIALKRKYQKTTYYKKFIAKIMQEAKKQNVDLVSGTSFGFNTTRVYLTALHSEFGEPFVRISVGTEPKYFLEQIQKVFMTVFNEL